MQSGDESGIVALWERCGLTRPWNDPHKDIRRKLADSPEGFLVGLIDDRIVASCMVGYDGHRGWIAYFGVDPECQRQGLGRQLMVAAEQILRARGCPKINLQVRSSNTAAVEFYRQIGFLQDDVLSFGKRLEVDDPSAKT